MSALSKSAIAFATIWAACLVWADAALQPVGSFLPKLTVIASGTVASERGGIPSLMLSNSSPHTVWIYRHGREGGALVWGVEKQSGTKWVSMMAGFCLHPHNQVLQELKPNETMPLGWSLRPDEPLKDGTYRFHVLAETFGLSPDSWLMPRRRLFARQMTSISTDAVVLPQRTR